MTQNKSIEMTLNDSDRPEESDPNVEMIVSIKRPGTG